MKFSKKVYEIQSNKLKDGQRLSFVLLSDLHLAEYGEGNALLIQEIKEINPDAILLSGDMVNAKEKHNTRVAEELLCALALDYPVYYAMGNHEERLRIKVDIYGMTFHEYRKKIEDAGVKLLRNKREKVNIHGVPVCIYGLALPLSYYQRLSDIHLETEKLYELIGEPDKDSYNILLAHHPRYAETYFAWGADLALSGHIHGGIMRLGNRACLSPDLCFFPKYGYGKYENGDQVMVVGGGLGEHTMPFRLFNPKELVHMVIK